MSSHTGVIGDLLPTTAETVAADELLRSIQWSVGAVRRDRLMAGHDVGRLMVGPHFAYVSTGAVTLRAAIRGEHPVGGGRTPDTGPSATTELSLAAGDFLLLPRGAQLRVRPVDGPAELVSGSLSVAGAAFPAFTELMPTTLFSCSAAVREKVHRGLLEMIDAELAAGRPDGSAVLTRMIDLVVSATLRAWLESGCGRASEWLVQLKDPRMRRVLEAIHAEPGTPWTVERLARLANTSRSQFAEVFRGTVGDTPARYLTRVRMRRAEDLLRAGRSVGQVAYDLGYDSDEGFRRAFARHTGSAPTAWRRQAAAGAAGTAAPSTALAPSGAALGVVGA